MEGRELPKLLSGSKEFPAKGTAIGPNVGRYLVYSRSTRRPVWLECGK